MKIEQTECSEMLAYEIQMPGNYPEESIQHSEHGESLKCCIFLILLLMAAPQYWGFKSHDFLDNKQSHQSKTEKTNPAALANLKSPVFSHKMPPPSYQLASDPVTFADLKSPPTLK